MANQGFAVFVIFFGIGLLDALRGGHWKQVLFWMSIGALSWALGRVRLGKRTRSTRPADSPQSGVSGDR